MLIIVEGPNKCGKTTLVNKILEQCSDKNFEVIKCSQPKIENDINYAFEEYSNIIKKIENNKEKNYILDRFHFGSFVYGPIYRGKSDFSLDKFVELEVKLEELNALLILCIANKKFIEKKFKEENEEFAKIDLISEEIKLFKEVKRYSRLMIMNHNLPKEDNTEKIIKTIKRG